MLDRRTVNIALIVFLVLAICFKILNPILSTYFEETLNPSEQISYYEIQMTILINNSIYSYVSGAAFAVFNLWLAKKHSRNMLLWFLVGFVFQMVAVILFFVLEIYFDRKIKLSEDPSEDNNSASTEVD